LIRIFDIDFFGKYILPFLLGFFLAIAVGSTFSHSRPYATDNFDDGPVSKWYKEIKIPPGNPMVPHLGGAGCCNESDCHPTEDRIVNGHYQALVGHRRDEDGVWELEKWIDIPDEIWKNNQLVNNPANPTGHAVICHTPPARNGNGWDYSLLNIYCFFPSGGY